MAGKKVSKNEGKRSRNSSADESAALQHDAATNGVGAALQLPGSIDGEHTHIVVRGAREHNLKNINLDIPRDQFVVITGLSGSGKSSLAFDTLYAEGQRRYVESLSVYARQFLGMMEKPDVDVIEGLSPAISIEQKTVGHNPRSTVGTVTEVYDYIRLLYSKIGVQYCVDHPDIPVRKQSLDQIADIILERNNDEQIYILAPIVRGRKGHYREQFEQMRKAGYTRVRVDGEIRRVEEGMQVDRYKVHDIEVVVDRLRIKEEADRRLRDSLEMALNLGDDLVQILVVEGDEIRDETLYNRNNACPVCNRSYEPLAPNAFSFNSPYGACKSCDGLGLIRDFDPELLIPEPELSLNDGGIAPLGKARDTWLWKTVDAVCTHFGIDREQPLGQMEQDKIDILLNGAGKQEFPVTYVFQSGKSVVYKQKFGGILEHTRSQYDKTKSAAVRNNIEQFMATVTCPTCNGGRLRAESLAVRVHGASIREVTAYTIEEAGEYFTDLKLTERELRIGALILKEIVSRLSFLNDVGLQYLTLNRAARSLSGGEAQRIRLASQIGSQLVGVMYVLDEPSIGLHQHDNGKLIESLKHLRDLGNTVLVVEHDREMIEKSDYLIDLGPRAGVHGGEVILAGEPDSLNNMPDATLKNSLTAQYLTDRKLIEMRTERRGGNDKFLILSGARGNNLHSVNLCIPLETFTCVTGMSGSGKSTLINKTLFPILSQRFYRSNTRPMPYATIEGLEHVDKVIEIDQTPIGRTPRSNPATYTGLFTMIRDLFAQLPESKIRGYKPGRFSFNVVGGRCEECQGDGVKKIEMNFLPDVYVECDVCFGRRYNHETLQVTYRNKSISDVLKMTVEEALDFFRDIPKIQRKAQALFDVGLSYIHLGQQATTLSGGEAQRVKLATELAKIGTGKTLYILDEPTTGLHFEDIDILLKLLHRLVDMGNTVLVIEHNLDVVKTADWIIDLGPGGGKHGGRIIAEGTPEMVVEEAESFTGAYLRPELMRHAETGD